MKTKRKCFSCGSLLKTDVCRPEIITSVTVAGETNPRRVFYVLSEKLFDPNGRVCHSLDSVGIQLANALGRRDVDAVNGIVWDALNFVYDGDVPKDWLRKRRKEKAVPLAI